MPLKQRGMLDLFSVLRYYMIVVLATLWLEDLFLYFFSLDDLSTCSEPFKRLATHQMKSFNFKLKTSKLKVYRKLMLQVKRQVKRQVKPQRCMCSLIVT